MYTHSTKLFFKQFNSFIIYITSGSMKNTLTKIIFISNAFRNVLFSN